MLLGKMGGYERLVMTFEADKQREASGRWYDTIQY